MKGSIGKALAIGFHGTLVAALLLAASPARPQPVRDRILDQVDIEGSCLRVTFSFPLRYVTHYPPEAGSELRVRLRPLQVGIADRDALLHDEAVAPRGRKSLGVDEVLYEGDIPGGPYLTVRFTKTVHYRIREMRDFRGLVIVLGGAEEDDECRTSRRPGRSDGGGGARRSPP